MPYRGTDDNTEINTVAKADEKSKRSTFSQNTTLFLIKIKYSTSKNEENAANKIETATEAYSRRTKFELRRWVRSSASCDRPT